MDKKQKATCTDTVKISIFIYNVSLKMVCGFSLGNIEQSIIAKLSHT